MKRILALMVVGISTVALAADPVDPTGTDWTGAGVVKLSVKKAGKVGSPQLLDIWFPGGGQWAAEDAGYNYGGPYTMVGPTTAVFDYDPAGTAELEDYLEDTILALAGIPVDVTVLTSAGAARFKAKDGNLLAMKYKFMAALAVDGPTGTLPGKFTVKGVAAPD